MFKVLNPREDAQGQLAFNQTYSDLAHMQTSFNKRYLAKLVEKIQERFPDRSAPLRLLDIGCGGGDATLHLYQLLTDLNYKNIVIDAIDISAEQIAAAKTRHADKNLPIHFGAQDALTVNEAEKYDICFSMFTFHWIADKSTLANKIANSLKPEGILFYLAVTNLDDWYAIRKKVLEQVLADAKWQPFLAEFKLHQFASFSEYLSAFDNDELYQDKVGVAHNEMLHYTWDQFKKFFESWSPELRQLKAKANNDEEYLQLKEAYLSLLYAEIPKASGSDVFIEEEKVHFKQHYMTFFGKSARQQVAVAPPANDEIAREQLVLN